MNDWTEIDRMMRVETADTLERCGHIYWAMRLRLLPPIVDFASGGRAEDLLAEINVALGLGLASFDRRAA